jgi:CRP-like cAMP-binding protein
MDKNIDVMDLMSNPSLIKYSKRTKFFPIVNFPELFYSFSRIFFNWLFWKNSFAILISFFINAFDFTIMETLLKRFESIYPLSEECKERLFSVIKFKALPKKQFLLRAGHVCQHIYFIEKGLLRCFYYKNEVEICSWFMREGDVIISVESFFRQSTSYESIQSLEDCELYYISYIELQEIYRNFPEFNFVGRALTEKYFCLSEQKLYSIRMMRASERYEYLLQQFPELAMRVPAKYLASYLGITPEMFSKIKSGKNYLSK